MNETPRTDAVQFCYEQASNGMFGGPAKFAVKADFARQLERELSEAKAHDSDIESRLWSAQKCYQEVEAENAELRQQLLASQLECERMREVIENSRTDINNLRSGNGDPVDKLFSKYVERLDGALSTTPPTDTLQKVKEALEMIPNEAWFNYQYPATKGNLQIHRMCCAAGHALNLLEGKEGK